MEQVQVEIVVQTITAQYGTLEVGAVLRSPVAFAKHLVEDCLAAKYYRPAARTSAPAAGDTAQLDGAVAVVGVSDVQTSAQAGQVENQSLAARASAPAAPDGGGVQTSALAPAELQIAAATAGGAVAETSAESKPKGKRASVAPEQGG